MNRNSTRLDDKLNLMALSTIVAMVMSIGSAMVSVEIDTDASATAQTHAAAQTAAPAQNIASITVAAAH